MIAESTKKVLEEVVRAEDRRHPKAFVGRSKEMRMLEGVASDVASAPETPVRTACRIIHGSPGAGKSTLCTEFVNKINAGASVETGGKRNPLVAVRLTPASLIQPPLRLVQYLNEQVAQVGRRNYSRGALKFFSGIAGAWQTGQRFLKSEGLAELKRERHGLTDESSLEHCLGVFAENIWRSGLTLVVCMDEAQNCNAESDRSRNNLQALYDGEHLGRVALYCFGLADTVVKMQDMGMSRIDAGAKIRLGSMMQGEGRELLDKNLDAFGLSDASEDWMGHLRQIGMSSDDWRKWRGSLVHRLEKASDNFPQHLNAGLRAACQVILESPANAPFGEPELDRVMQLHAEHRISYYEGLLSSKGIGRHRTALGSICVLFDLLRKSGRKAIAFKSAARRLIASTSDSGAPVSHDLSEQAMEKAIAKGVLESLALHPDGKLVEHAEDYVLPPPIPSMETYLASRFLRNLESEDPVALAVQKELDAILASTPSPPPRPIVAKEKESAGIATGL